MSWRRILLLSTVLVAVLFATTWALLQNSNVATEFVRRELQKAFATPVEVAATSIGLQAGRLQLDGFRLTDPTAPERALARFETGRVDVQVDPFGAGVAPRHVVVEGLHLELGPAVPTTEQLLAASPASGSTSAGASLPVLEVRSGTATLHVAAGERPIVLEQLRVTAVPLGADPQKLQLEGFAHLQQPSAELRLAGEFDLGSGAAVLTLETKEVSCSPEVVQHIARLAGAGGQEVDASGNIEALRVTCTLPPRSAADRTLAFEVEATCSEVRLDAQRLPPVVHSADVQLYVDTRADGTVEAKVSQRDEAGAFDVCARVTGLSKPDGTAPDFEVEATGRDLIWNEDLREALRSFRIGRQVVTALQPTAGRADIDLYLRNPQLPDGLTDMDLQLRDVAMSFQGFGDEETRIGFPLPLEHGSGRVVLRDRVLLLRDMKAAIAADAGGGEVTLRGSLEVPRGGRTSTSLDIFGADVAFEDDLRRALATLLRDDGELYDKLSPSGRADVHVVVRPQDMLPGGFGVEVMPRAATMRWAGFPYDLRDLRGAIQVGMGDVRFELEGAHGEGGLSMRGRIPLAKQHAPEEGFEAVIELDRLAVDDELRAGVATIVEELDAPWRAAAPSGRLSGTVKVWRPQPDEPLLHDVRLELEEVDLALPLPPWRATGLRGQVLVQGADADARIDFDSLRGELSDGSSPPAKLALLGHLESGPTVVRDLAFVVRDLELGDQLGRSLDELGALDLQTWRSLRPSGAVDLVVRERADPQIGEDLELVVQLVDVRSDAQMLPKPAEHMTGELHVHAGELTFREVRGELAGAQVTCRDGRVRQRAGDDRRTEISLHVHAQDVPVDDGLANLFTGPLHDAVLQRQLRGVADVDGLQLQFLVPSADSSQPFATTLAGGLNLDGVDLLLGAGRDGLRLQDLHGQLTLERSTVTERDGALAGSLAGGSVSLLGHQLDAVAATFVADAQELRVDELRARLHDGVLDKATDDAPALRYTLPGTGTPEGRLAADLRFERLDVFSLLATSGWKNPPYRGLAGGELHLGRLDGADLVGAEARGRLRVERGDLGKVPLFAAIYAQLPAADQPRFEELDVRFRLEDEALRLEQLDVRSQLLAAKGKGKLDLDGHLDIEMELDNLLGQSADPLVMPLIDYLAKNLVSFRLYGHLRDLRASTEFLGAGAPGRRPIMPVPPTRPARPAPGY